MTDLVDESELLRRIEPLLEEGSARLDELPVPVTLLRQLGFQVDGQVVRLPVDRELLEADLIRDSLSHAARNWLRKLSILRVVGSTSGVLLELASHRSVNGVVMLAELQTHGRGRRGRRWLSPYATNLALSLGIQLDQSVAELGGLSLCIGLAVVDRLQALGVRELELKWPNDILCNGAKLAGILIELQVRHPGTEAIVGIGVNFELPRSAREDIDQPAAELLGSGLDLSRNRVAAELISGVVDYSRAFAEEGFGAMREAFNQRHRFHGRACRLILGAQQIDGVVHGVTEIGEIILDTADGIRTFSAGEVSLRALK